MQSANSYYENDLLQEVVRTGWLCRRWFVVRHQMIKVKRHFAVFSTHGYKPQHSLVNKQTHYKIIIATWTTLPRPWEAYCCADRRRMWRWARCARLATPAGRPSVPSLASRCLRSAQRRWLLTLSCSACPPRTERVSNNFQAIRPTQTRSVI